MKKPGKLLRIFLITTFILIIAVIINFVPALHLKTKGMQVLHGTWVNVYYETEEAAAKDVFALADDTGGELAAKLGFKEKPDVNIYIYDQQSAMQTKKYGLIGPALKLDWYIGDNIKTNVILTSPANPGRVHNYQNNKYAALHEMVHAYVSVMNPGISLWLTEGMALYLTNGLPFCKDYLNDHKIPSYSDTRTVNPVKFSNMGGYTFAHTYIEYIDRQYGWDKVLKLIQTENYKETLGKSGKDVYEEWTAYLENYDQ